MRAATARRAAEKSLAITGPSPRAFRAAITASPTGPQPITMHTAPGPGSACATACSPTAIGSTIAAASVASPLGTGSSIASCSSICSAKPPGYRLE